MLRFFPPSSLSFLVSSCIRAISTSPSSWSLTLKAYYEKRKRPSTTIPTTPPLPSPPPHPTYLLADALGLEYVSALKRKVIKMQDLLVLETTERFEIRFTSNTSLKATQGNE